MLLQLRNPISSAIFRRLPVNYPLPDNETVEVEDWQKASIAYQKFCHTHDLVRCDALIFDEELLVARISGNGCVWPPVEWRPDLKVLYEPTDNDKIEARGLPPEAAKIFAAAREDVRRIMGYVPPKDVFDEGQGVLVYTPFNEIDAVRCSVIERRLVISSDISVASPRLRYKVVNSSGVSDPYWIDDDHVHSRSPDEKGDKALSFDRIEKLSAEFAAVPVGTTGKTLGRVVSEALLATDPHDELVDNTDKDAQATELLSELVRLASLAFADDAE